MGKKLNARAKKVRERKESHGRCVYDVKQRERRGVSPQKESIRRKGKEMSQGRLKEERKKNNGRRKKVAPGRARKKSRKKKTYGIE